MTENLFKTRSQSRKMRICHCVGLHDQGEPWSIMAPRLLFTLVRAYFHLFKFRLKVNLCRESDLLLTYCEPFPDCRATFFSLISFLSYQTKALIQKVRTKIRETINQESSNKTCSINSIPSLMKHLRENFSFGKLKRIHCLAF